MPLLLSQGSRLFAPSTSSSSPASSTKPMPPVFTPIAPTMAQDMTTAVVSRESTPVCSGGCLQLRRGLNLESIQSQVDRMITSLQTFSGELHSLSARTGNADIEDLDIACSQDSDVTTISEEIDVTRRREEHPPPNVSEFSEALTRLDNCRPLCSGGIIFALSSEKSGVAYALSSDCQRVLEIDVKHNNKQQCLDYVSFSPRMILSSSEVEKGYAFSTKVNIFSNDESAADDEEEGDPLHLHLPTLKNSRCLFAAVTLSAEATLEAVSLGEASFDPSSSSFALEVCLENPGRIILVAQLVSGNAFVNGGGGNLAPLAGCSCDVVVVERSGGQSGAAASSDSLSTVITTGAINNVSGSLPANNSGSGPNRVKARGLLREIEALLDSPQASTAFSRSHTHAGWALDVIHAFEKHEDGLSFKIKPSSTKVLVRFALAELLEALCACAILEGKRSDDAAAAAADDDDDDDDFDWEELFSVETLRAWGVADPLLFHGVFGAKAAETLSNGGGLSDVTDVGSMQVALAVGVGVQEREAAYHAVFGVGVAETLAKQQQRATATHAAAAVVVATTPQSDGDDDEPCATAGGTLVEKDPRDDDDDAGEDDDAELFHGGDKEKSQEESPEGSTQLQGRIMSETQEDLLFGDAPDGTELNCGGSGSQEESTLLQGHTALSDDDNVTQECTLVASDYDNGGDDDDDGEEEDDEDDNGDDNDEAEDEADDAGKAKKYDEVQLGTKKRTAGGEENGQQPALLLSETGVENDKAEESSSSSKQRRLSTRSNPKRRSVSFNDRLPPPGSVEPPTSETWCCKRCTLDNELGTDFCLACGNKQRISRRRR